MDVSRNKVRLLKPLDEVEKALQKQIDEGAKLLNPITPSMEHLKSREDEAAIYHNYTRKLLSTLFTGSEMTSRFDRSADIVLVSSRSFDQQWAQFKDIMRLRLRELKSILLEAPLFQEEQPGVIVASSNKEQNKMGTKVFIVHGHDEATKLSVARLLEHLEIEPVILHERANLSRTIIEKLEEESQDAGYAVILLTPDDEGKSKQDNKLNPRARQNVILELGYFVNKLGRRRVCALYCEGVELPTDFDGVLYTPLDSAGAWQTKLARELIAAGIKVNTEKFLK